MIPGFPVVTLATEIKSIVAYKYASAWSLCKVLPFSISVRWVSMYLLQSSELRWEPRKKKPSYFNSCKLWYCTPTWNNNRFGLCKDTTGIAFGVWENDWDEGRVVVAVCQNWTAFECCSNDHLFCVACVWNHSLPSSWVATLRRDDMAEGRRVKDAAFCWLLSWSELSQSVSHCSVAVAPSVQ